MACNGIGTNVHGHICYIIGKGNLPFRINIFDKALLPSAFRTGQLRASLVFLERKSVFSHSSSFFINAVRAVCSCCSFAGYPCLLNCKLQILQGANRVAHCSFSYSPLLIFLITLLVVRLTNIYITDLSDRPTSFPAWMASAVENKLVRCQAILSFAVLCSPST